mmetsp:Transcript_37517/g.86582  ORF Transcript_37517/g.86582 Transcript_37517/m.86582 type:complete len:254 (+) Transcript_37517:1326-2087(+)
MGTLNLVNCLSCVFTGWIHDWQDATKLHASIAFREGDAKRLEARLTEVCILLKRFLAHLVVVADLPLDSLIIILGLQHNIHHSLGNLHGPSVHCHSNNSSLHDWVEAEEFSHSVLLLECCNCIIHCMWTLALHRLGICPEHCCINWVILVGCVRCQSCILEHRLRLQVSPSGGLVVVVDRHLCSCQSTSLVRAEDFHGGNLLQRCQVCDNTSLVSHLLGADGKCHLHHHGQRHWYGSNHQGERHLQHVKDVCF